MAAAYAAGEVITKIAKRFGMSTTAVDSARKAAGIPNRVRPDRTGMRYKKTLPEHVAERMAEIPEDTRSLTGRFCGDPLPTRSALALRSTKAPAFLEIGAHERRENSQSAGHLAVAGRQHHAKREARR